MSEQRNGWTGAGSSARRAIGVSDSYADAERTVDRLSDLGFPVERVAIVGHDLKLTEQVTGRLNLGGAALRGAGSGALTGLLIGWLFSVFSWFTTAVGALLLMLYSTIFGAVIGALFGLAMHWAQRGRRDFSSFRTMAPTRYEVLVDDEVADEAARLLASTPAPARSEANRSAARHSTNTS
jgi:hypothetical protein